MLNDKISIYINHATHALVMNMKLLFSTSIFIPKFILHHMPLPALTPKEK